MTLAQVIERFEAQRPPQAASATLTPLGDATASVYRLRRTLAQLDAGDRADILDLLKEEVFALPATA